MACLKMKQKSLYCKTMYNLSLSPLVSDQEPEFSANSTWLGSAGPAERKNELNSKVAARASPYILTNTEIVYSTGS